MLLSICLPTFNRLPYLKELLAALLPQVKSLPHGDVEVLVSDNKSTDGTADFCVTLDYSSFRFWSNTENIGGDRNFLKCIREARGEYVWLIGDDDILPDRAVERVVQFLKTYNPALLISADINGVDGLIYENYRTALTALPEDFAIRHTLISANVFKRECFDMPFATSKLWTQYAHMFGVIEGMRDERIGVISRIVEVRPVRPDFAEFPSCLCVKQAVYLWYLARKLGLKRFYWKAFLNACNLPIEYASRLIRWLMRL